MNTTRHTWLVSDQADTDGTVGLYDAKTLQIAVGVSVINTAGTAVDPALRAAANNALTVIACLKNHSEDVDAIGNPGPNPDPARQARYAEALARITRLRAALAGPLDDGSAKWTADENAGRPVFYAEFPDVEIPAPLIGGGWEDAAYHHDAAPHSTRALAGGAALEAWVNYPAETDRANLGPRYLLQLIRDEAGEAFALYHGDDLAALEMAVIAALAD